MRLCLATIATVVLSAGAPAHATVTPVVTTPPPADRPAQVECTVTDPRLAQLSGLSVRRGSYYAVSDQKSAVYRLDGACKITAEFPIEKPFVDLEDLGQSVDGLLWMADIGGNRAPRTTVALVRYNPESGNAVRYPLVYPDGPHDAEAVLVTPNARAFIVTKSDDGVSAVYTAPSPLLADAPNAMTKVTEINFRDFDERTRGNGSVLVTGGAVSYDGTHFVLRTYKDAYEWSAPDTDIAAALVEGTPTVIPLPDSVQGEAVSYDEGGLRLVIGTEQLPAPVHSVPLPSRGEEMATAPAPRARSFISTAALAVLVAVASASVVWQLLTPTGPRRRVRLMPSRSTAGTPTRQ